jgi:predicted Zn-dependent peptidase
MTAEVTRLANGMAVLSWPIAHVSTAAVGLYADVGARHEDAAGNGLAHFLEHMVFKGAGVRDARAIAESIEDAGGQLNAWTSRDTTAFHARVLANEVARATDLIADLVLEPHFTDADIARERGVVASEIAEARDVPDDCVWDLAQATAWPGQPLGRPILGTEAGLERFDAAALRGWLGTHYRGPSLVLAAAGHVDHAALVAQAEARFGHLPADAGPAPTGGAWVGGAAHERRRIDQTQVVLAWEGPGVRGAGYLATQLFASLAGGGMSSRLFQELREERGLAYSVSASHGPYAETGLFAVHAATAPGDADRAVALARDVLRACAEGATPVELARAKAQLKAGSLMALEDAGGLASWAAQRWLSHGALLSMEALVADIDAVTLEDVRAAGAAMLGGQGVTAAVGPRKLAA